MSINCSRPEELNIPGGIIQLAEIAADVSMSLEALPAAHDVGRGALRLLVYHKTAGKAMLKNIDYKCIHL